MKKNQANITGGKIENKLFGNENIISQNNKNTSIDPEESRSVIASQSLYLLTQSNRLYLLETLSKKGINHAVLILKTVENILDEYANLNFNDLLDGVTYLLIRLPEKQKQQELINKELPMAVDIKTSDVINITYMMEKTAAKPSKNNKSMITNLLSKNLSVMVEGGLKSVGEIKRNQEKTTEDLNEIDKEFLPDLSKLFNRTFLIEWLNTVGIEGEKLIINSAKEIMFEYPRIKFKELLDGMMYRLITLPSKQKKKDKTNQFF